MIYAIAKFIKTKQLELKIGKMLKVVVCEGLYIKTSKAIYCFDNDGFYII